MSVQTTTPGRDVTLTDKYELTQGRAFMTGTQALVRLLLVQRLRDQAAGLNTAGFVSGYRGSPLTSVDQELWRAKKALPAHHVTFLPGVNEDLAATSIWGTQQVNLFDGARYDGVFGMWYGKGPGVDRSADALRHANHAGTWRHGGVLAVAGDDHACKSSTVAHQTDQIFSAVGIPVLAPSGVQDILDLGIHGWAMSRYSGCWVALKAVTDVIETSSSVDVTIDRVRVDIPEDLQLPPSGLSIRDPDPFLEQEHRLLNWKLPAVAAYARANGLNSIVLDSPRARLGIVSTGKSYLDLRQALTMLGLDEGHAQAMGLRVYKVGMVWPLEPQGALRFADGLEEILVVEEKRSLIEEQLRDLLYALPDSRRPRIVGKTDRAEDGTSRPLLHAHGELAPDEIALAVGERVQRLGEHADLAERMRAIAARRTAASAPRPVMARPPHYCSGCPHNTSTKVPEGSRATAGIGCHGMATFIYPATKMFSQMGGEGMHWVGQAPFTETKHVFANMGEGTYFHSGLLAIRAAVAAKTAITYKILYNDAVAMTGGQPVDGPISVPRVTRQLAAEGVEKIHVVSDEPEKYAQVTSFASGVTVHHRRELDALQRELRDYPGVSVLVYDQTCAAELRRRRKRGKAADPDKRVVINHRVCESCGDCSNKSNCISVVPIETEFGTKRAIDQSSCNKDYSCVDGFCPSFVTVIGGRLRKGTAQSVEALGELPDPALPSLEAPHGILVTGIGGTGVVTIGALLGMAAHVEGRAVTVLDMAGLAQKGGSVWSHIRIANDASELHASRIAAGEATALIGADIVVATSPEALGKLQRGRTRAVVNTNRAVTGEQVRGFASQARTGELTSSHQFPALSVETMQDQIVEAVGRDGADFLDATAIATALMGDAIATNLFLLGFAYQKGLVPLHEESILAAIELNGTAVASNQTSFQWGRRMAADPDGVSRHAGPERRQPLRSRTLDEVVAVRVRELTSYQDAAYADRYRRLVERARAAEERACGQPGPLTEAVARYYYKLLAYKDEYEVARLHADPAFRKSIEEMFEGDYHVEFNLSPPVLQRVDPTTGEPRKRRFGPWMITAFQGLARMKRLRGTWADPFGRHEDRRTERALVAHYEEAMGDILPRVNSANVATAVEIAALPDQIRGYGYIKKRHLERAMEHEKHLMARFNGHLPATVGAS